MGRGDEVTRLVERGVGEGQHERRVPLTPVQDCPISSPPGSPVGCHRFLWGLKHTLTSVFVVEVKPPTGLTVVKVPRI